MLEFALVFPILALTIFSFMDLSRAVFYYNSVARAAQAGARYAIVHGKFSGDPVPLDPGGGCGDELTNFVLGWLPGLAASDVTVTCTWDPGVDNDPDLYNFPSHHVQVGVSATYWPIVPLEIGFNRFTLTGQAVMTIVH
jgi:hypothetical protein